MDRRQLLSLAALAPASPLLGLGPPVEVPTSKTLEAALSFGRGGGYDRSWRGSGVPEDVVIGGEKVLKRAGGGSYCCGFTFAAAVKALEGSKALAKLDAAEGRAFQKAWYGATEASAETQCAYAVERFGLGRKVKAEDAMAGDFCQLWRSSKKPSGHSVLFLSWIELAGKRAGLCYLSSQGSTDGIGYGVEFFADSGVAGGRVDPERLWFARLDVGASDSAGGGRRR